MCGVSSGGLLCGTSIESIESIKSIESMKSIESIESVDSIESAELIESLEFIEPLTLTFFRIALGLNMHFVKHIFLSAYSTSSQTVTSNALVDS